MVTTFLRSQHQSQTTLPISTRSWRFKRAGLMMNSEKCQFGKKEVQFLGHILSAGKVSTLPEKVVRVREFPRTTSKKQLQLYLANFYRCFVPAFAAVATPLYDLLKKGKSWNWGVREETAFQELKCRLSQDPVVLTIPDFKVQFDNCQLTHRMRAWELFCLRRAEWWSMQVDN